MLQHLPALTDRALSRGLRIRGYRGEHLETHMGRVHVLSAKGRGTLPPILVLHGLSSAAAHYLPLLQKLRKRCQAVYALDMPGHGASEAPPSGLCQLGLRIGLVEAIDQLVERTGPIAIFGNSLGGAAAIRYAAERPASVLSLVLAAPGGAPMDDRTFEDFHQRIRMRRHSDALDFVDRLFYRRPTFRQALALGIRHQFSRPSVAQLVGSFRAEDALRPEELAALRMPTLVLWGGADRVFPDGSYEFFARHLPAHATLLRVEEYGHVPHICHLDDLTLRIVDHLFWPERRRPDVAGSGRALRRMAAQASSSISSSR
jgi:pimeloyl-ACP methyl ester carboxylesterase